MVEEWPSGDQLDTGTPNVARVWDFYLGGKDNFAADRKAAELLNQACQRVGAPTGAEVARENRAFLGRAVTYLASRGIDQFIDLGAGLPTRRNVHEIAQAVNPAARTVYVDYDPLVVSHGRALLADTPQTIMIRADVRGTSSLLEDPALRDHLDLRRPVAVLLVAVLHLLPDDEQPAKIVTEIRDRLAPGSCLALTHVSSDSRPSAATVVAAEFTRLGVTTPFPVPSPRSAGSLTGGTWSSRVWCFPHGGGRTRTTGSRDRTPGGCTPA